MGKPTIRFFSLNNCRGGAHRPPKAQVHGGNLEPWVGETRRPAEAWSINNLGTERRTKFRSSSKMEIESMNSPTKVGHVIPVLTAEQG